MTKHARATSPSGGDHVASKRICTSPALSQTSTAPPESRLLALPGELRNHIYELAIADNDPEQCNLTYTPHSISEFPPARHRGLTQVNKLLRAEFLPLYRKAVKVIVRPCHLAEYLKTFPLDDRATSEAIRTVLTEDLSAFPCFNELPFLSLHWFPTSSSIFNPRECVRQATNEDDSDPTNFLSHLKQSQKLWKNVLKVKVDPLPDCPTSDEVMFLVLMLDEPRVQDEDALRVKKTTMKWFVKACGQARISRLVFECSIYGVAVSHNTVGMQYTPK